MIVFLAIELGLFQLLDLAAAAGLLALDDQAGLSVTVGGAEMLGALVALEELY